MKHSLLFFLVSMLSGVVPVSGQIFKTGEPPAWVKTVDIPAKQSKSKYDVLTGTYLTLLDIQSNLGENTTFSRQVLNIVSYSGITTASQITVVLDTSYQQLTINHLYIWRKGTKIDRTQSISLEVLKNESNLEQGIYTGLITAHDILDDIRKDDMIDFAYTLSGSNPILDNEKYLYLPFVSINPVDLYSVKLLYPLTADYTYKCVGCDSLIKVSESGQNRCIDILINNLEATLPEENTPDWYMPDRYFLLSSFKSWSAVNQWAMRVFALQAEPDLDNVFKEIFTGTETTEQKINKVINYVQDDIRYMGVETGIGSMKPFPPEQVVKRRFGDCKDKSLLLVWLLKKIGVSQAYPALVNTGVQHQLTSYLPGNEVFTHCIVTFNYDNAQYWVDPTTPLQGGDFRNLYTYDFGRVLVIGLASDSLQLMAVKNMEPQVLVMDEYTMKSFTEPASLKITSTRSGYEADSRRAFFEFINSDVISDQITKDIKLIFPVAYKTDNPQISDDPEKNTFTVEYNYEVDGFWKDCDQGSDPETKGLWIFRFEPVMLYNDINVSGCVERKSDFMLDYPLNLDYQVIFHFPSDILIIDDYKKFDNPAFLYEEKTEQLSRNTVKLQYLLKTKKKAIPASEFVEMCRQKNEIADKFVVAFYFNK